MHQHLHSGVLVIDEGVKALLHQVFQPLTCLVDSVLAAVALPGLLIVVLFIVAAVVHGRDVRRRDPVRRFNRQQLAEGMARAGGQCEMEAGLGRRCSRPAEHGDHFFPWSKGGSTTLQNFVAAYARCNRTKGARIPSPGGAWQDRWDSFYLNTPNLAFLLPASDYNSPESLAPSPGCPARDRQATKWPGSQGALT
jgi:hypothetical protein